MTDDNKDENKLYITLSKQIKKEEKNINTIMGYSFRNFQNFMDSLQPTINQIIENTKYIQKVINPMQEVVSKVLEFVTPLIEVMTSQIPKYTPYFRELQDAIEKAKENPDSLINWYHYTKKLSEYLWTIPFDIDSKKLKNIFEKINSEEEFDYYMTKYFTNKKLMSYLYLLKIYYQ